MIRKAKKAFHFWKMTLFAIPGFWLAGMLTLYANEAITPKLSHLIFLLIGEAFGIIVDLSVYPLTSKEWEKMNEKEDELDEVDWENY